MIDSALPSATADLRSWRDLSESAERSGDYLGACDAALTGLDQYPTDRDLQYRAVLNLSRAGARQRASELWNAYGLQDAVDRGALDAKSAQDIAALGARLKREAAFAAPDDQRPARLREAAASYEAVYRRTQTTFPAVNAAVLYALSGTQERAQEIAGRIIEQCDRAGPLAGDDAYQAMADRATADLLLRRLDAAHDDLAAAAKLAVKASSIASTRKQLLQLCRSLAIDTAVLAPLKNRAVLHYAAQASAFDDLADGLDAAEETRLAQDVRNFIDTHDVGFVYGAANSGAEIVAAEAMLGCNADLGLVLPYARDSFRAEIASRNGPQWSQRLDGLLARATVTQATNGDYAPDPEVFAYTARLAMGMAVLRAQNLAADVMQIVIGKPRDGGGLQAAQEWSRRSLETIVIAPEFGKSPSSAPRPPPSPVPARKVRAVIFGDFHHFSRLNDSQMLTFFTKVMGAVASVLDRYDDRIVVRNTWGDGLYIVLDDIAAAAQCALDIQVALHRLDLVALGLPADLGLRVGLHAGAVFEIEDPVLKSVGFTGSDICRTARIEPGTPPGQVYVTEAFAALLAMVGETGIFCEYVGLMKAAKNYGTFRTYVLRRE